MKKAIHKIKWEARWNKTKSDIFIEVTDIDCIVKEVTHPIAKWAIGEYWYVVCRWFQDKCATVILGEPEEITERVIADEFPRHEKNPRRLNELEKIERLIYVKS